MPTAEFSISSSDLLPVTLKDLAWAQGWIIVTRNEQPKRCIYLNNYWLAIHIHWDGYKLLNQVVTIHCPHVPGWPNKNIGKIRWLKYWQLWFRTETSLDVFPDWFHSFFSVCWCFLPIAAFGNTQTSLCGLKNEIWHEFESQWPTCFSLPGTVLVLTLKVPYTRKFHCPRQMRQLVNLEQAFLSHFYEYEQVQSTCSKMTQQLANGSLRTFHFLSVMWLQLSWKAGGSLCALAPVLPFTPQCSKLNKDLPSGSWASYLNSLRSLTGASSAS